MIETDFRSSVDRAIRHLGDSYLVEGVSKDERMHEGFGGADEVWKASLLIRDADNTLNEVAIFIEFDNDFPYSFPSFILPKAYYEKIAPIPHLSKDRILCTYLLGSADLNEKSPEIILWDCLMKAITTLEDGICGNNSEDFEDEFFIYWKEDSDVKSRMLSLIGETIIGKERLIEVRPSLGEYSIALVDEGEDSQKFLKSLEELGIKHSPANYILSDQPISTMPPFEVSVGDFFEQVKGHPDLARVKRGINTGAKTIIRSGRVGGKNHFFALTFPGIHKKFKDLFRRHHSDSSLLQKGSYEKPMTRQILEELTRTRIANRTRGEFDKRQHKFTIAGLGSIGSNLLAYLDSLNFPEFELIDPEKFTLDNIGRQSCSLNDVGTAKVVALGQLLLSRNLLREVKMFPSTFNGYLKSERQSLHEADCLFVLIGIGACERQIVGLIQQGKITVPTFIIWVEPFVAAGHILYLVPGDQATYEQLHPQGKFRYNTISPQSYDCDQGQLQLKDAGCGSHYTPYGYGDLTDFLAATWRHVKRYILEPPTQSQALTWIGDLETVRAKGIELSPFGVEHCGMTGNIIVHLWSSN